MQPRNIVELRNRLLENYGRIEQKKMPLNLAKELSNHAGKILSSVKFEMEYNQMMKNNVKIEFLEVVPPTEESTEFFEHKQTHTV